MAVGAACVPGRTQSAAEAMCVGTCLSANVAACLTGAGTLDRTPRRPAGVTVLISSRRETALTALPRVPARQVGVKSKWIKRQLNAASIVFNSSTTV